MFQEKLYKRLVSFIGEQCFWPLCDESGLEPASLMRVISAIGCRGLYVGLMATIGILSPYNAETNGKEHGK